MSQPPTLEYLNPNTIDPLPPALRELLFKIGLLCWLAPLTIGVGDFLLWLISRSTIFSFGGFYIIAGGTGLAFIGTVCAMVFVIKRWKLSAKKEREVILPALKLVLLLASNFLVAMLLIMIVLQIEPLG